MDGAIVERFRKPYKKWVDLSIWLAGFLPSVLGVMNYMELGRMRELDCPSLGAFILAESFSQGVRVFCKNDVSFAVYKRPCLKDIGCDGWCTILKVSPMKGSNFGKLIPTFPTKRIQTKSHPLVEVFVGSIQILMYYNFTDQP